MTHDYLMNIASALFFACYVPELYANYKNKNANVYNLPEKVVVATGSTFAFAYSVVNNDVSLMANYGPILFLDLVAMLMRLYYVYINIHYRKPDTPSAVPSAVPSDDDNSSVSN